MMNEMGMLLWKDFRLNKYCFIAGLIFIIMPYLLLLFPDIKFSAMWMFSTCLSQISMAILGGSIIASEREDRSAIFLSYQGASRKMIISSKLICCFFAFILINTIALILSLWISSNNFHNQFHARPWQIMGSASAIGLYFLGSCWLISLFSRPMLATVAGIISPYIIAPCLGGICYVLKIQVDDDMGVLIIIITFLFFGLISLVAGTWHFLRSKES